MLLLQLHARARTPLLLQLFNLLCQYFDLFLEICLLFVLTSLENQVLLSQIRYHSLQIANLGLRQLLEQAEALLQLQMTLTLLFHIFLN